MVRQILGNGSRLRPGQDVSPWMVARQGRSLTSKSIAGARTEAGPWAMNREGVMPQRSLGRSFSAPASLIAWKELYVLGTAVEAGQYSFPMLDCGSTFESFKTGEKITGNKEAFSFGIFFSFFMFSFGRQRAYSV